MDHYKNKTKKELIEDLKNLLAQNNALQSRDQASQKNVPENHRSDREIRGILEEIDDGYWEIDLEGNFVFCNDAMTRIMGYTHEELIGLNYRDYMDGDTADKIFKHFNEVFKTGVPIKPIVYDLVHKDGVPIIVEISLTLIRDHLGKPTGFRGITRDISERMETRELQQNYDLLRKTLGQTIQALSLAFEVRDPYTAGHHRRVSDLARSIATEMGFDRDMIDGIRIAGSIHDLGKISIPSEILNKPGPLSTIEYKLIKTHPQTGFDILKNIDFPWPVAKAVFQHHERINGSGYPTGMNGTDMIIEAKILAVSDVVEAMASHRPYRRAIGIERAMEEITVNRGTYYDTAVVDACLAVFADNKYTFKE